MMMSLCLRLPEHRDRKIRRYDRLSEEKFDFKRREKPSSSLFDAAEKEKRRNRIVVERGLRGVTLAEIALKTRCIAGMVLGGLVKSLYRLPENEGDEVSFDRKDVDVIVLNLHSPQSPAPNEWGIDWWVRPDGNAPTNGIVNSWYDVALKSDIQVGYPKGNSCSGRMDFNINAADFLGDASSEMEIAKRSLSMREKIRSALIPPGLYLPDRETMEKIHAHVLKKDPLNHSLDIGNTDGSAPLYPVLPDHFVKFRPL